ncbi:TIGR03089 family protein [Nesterenkonia halobia]|uniref:TIGR03089 family protein n=1 Tax=Nesterenkonia halobia TaxID=37922 RepID=A0ABP6REM8_9MICC
MVCRIRQDPSNVSSPAAFRGSGAAAPNYTGVGNYPSSAVDSRPLPHSGPPSRATRRGAAGHASARRVQEDLIAPLIPTTSSHEIPSSCPALLELLAARPQPAVVWYGPEGERVELSGRVLQNWAVKLIGLLREEVELVRGATVLVDTTPHWKAAAVVLACRALGAEPRITRRDAAADSAADVGADADPALVVTDRPAAWERSPALGDAELAALSPGLLDGSWAEVAGEELPAWVLDVSAEVRQHPDQLVEPLEELPLPALDLEALDRLDGLMVLEADAATTASSVAADWARWALRGWTTQTAAELLSLWARGRPAVLVDAEPGGPQWERALADESVG